MKNKYKKLLFCEGLHGNAIFCVLFVETIIPHIPVHRTGHDQYYVFFPHTLQVRWAVGYEPYMVGDRSKVPLYNETFIGRGRNKMSHSLTVHVQGYAFVFLHEFFLTSYEPVQRIV